jgi:heme-binding NEAT domain protein
MNVMKISLKKVVASMIALAMVFGVFAAVATGSPALKDGKYQINVTALQENNDNVSSADKNIIKPITLEVADGKIYAILTNSGHSSLGHFSSGQSRETMERAEVINIDKEANTRTIKFPVQSLDKPVLLQTTIIPAGGITVYYRIAFDKETLKPVTAVILDGRDLSFDVPPMIENGRTLVPLRAIFEALGAKVDWDGATQTVTAAKGQTVVKLTIGNTAAFVNDQPVNLDVPGKIVDNRTLVPLRFVSESLGADVQWDGDRNRVIINSPPIVKEVQIKAMHATEEGRVSSADANLIKPAKVEMAGGKTFAVITMNRADIMTDLGVINSAGEFKLAQVVAENLAGATSQEKTRTYKFEVASLDAPTMLQVTVNRGAAGGLNPVQFKLVFEK